jgi:uracil-DNA glycosylase
MSLLKFFKKTGDSNKSSSLTPEQKDLVEKNRQKALAKLAAKKRKSPSSSSSSSSDGSNLNSKRPRGDALSLESITDPGWRELLAPQEEKNYFKSLRRFVDAAYASKTIYPVREDIFAAFNQTPLDKVRVVVIGQDPYHGPGQAHGLAFSVRRGNKVPPSLANIYKELMSDPNVPNFNKEKPKHGYLTQWTRQGVLLLNTVLTVQKATAYSHRKKGWETFTKAALSKLATEREGLVFLCWGAGAHKLADECGATRSNKHLVIKTSHPSPLGATKTKSPFIGSQCFSKCNEFLVGIGRDPINWRIDNKEGL